LHIFNGGIEFGAGFASLGTLKPHTTLRLTSVKLTVTNGVERDVSSSGMMMLGTCKPHTSLVLEDCVFETACDSPGMSKITACWALPGGQVGLQDCGWDMHL
jgi:hypothetical protein